MFQIPREGETPLIRLFSSLEEMKNETGRKFSHGTFDPTTNTILATLDSLAHEIGHYRDFRSGRLRNPSLMSNSQARIEARLRNEIVAILFASTKIGDAGTSLPYEIEFMTWLEFMRKKDFGPHSGATLKDLQLSQIQDLAEFLADANSGWFEKLEYLFRDYLGSEHEVLTYAPKNKLK